MQRGISLAAILLAPTLAVASGFKVNEQGSKGGGMGLAFVGQADDATTIALNLAGIGQLDGTHAAFTAAAIYVPGREFETEIPDDLLDQQPDNQFVGLPSLYLTSDLGTERWHIGLGVYTMFGLTQDWQTTGTGGTVPGTAPPAGFARVADRAALKTVFINPVVAFEAIEDRLTLAAGFIAGSGDLTLEGNPVIDLTGFGLGVQEVTEFEEEVDGWGYSFNVGVHARIGDCVRAGAYYRHKLDLDMDGDFEADSLNQLAFLFAGTSSFETDEELFLSLPGTVGVGIAYQATDCLTLELDGEVNFWSVVDTIDVDLDAPLVSNTGAVVISEASLTQHPDWDDSWAIRVGGQYQVSKEVAVRAGYFFDTTPIPEDTLEPAVPDADRHGVTFGAGVACGSWTFDAAYMLVIPEDRDVNNTHLAPQIPVQDGEYTSDPTHVLMVTVGIHF